MLAVAIADAAEIDKFRFERRKFGAGAADLRSLLDWMVVNGVREAVMESTAQYRKPVWQALETEEKLYLAQAHYNKAPKGRKRAPRIGHFKAIRTVAIACAASRGRFCTKPAL